MNGIVGKLSSYWWRGRRSRLNWVNCGTATACNTVHCNQFRDNWNYFSTMKSMWTLDVCCYCIQIICKASNNLQGIAVATTRREASFMWRMLSNHLTWLRRKHIMNAVLTVPFSWPSSRLCSRLSTTLRLASTYIWLLQQQIFKFVKAKLPAIQVYLSRQ